MVSLWTTYPEHKKAAVPRCIYNMNGVKFCDLADAGVQGDFFCE